ncbi:MAG: hypothetical protein AAF391_04500 [Bacteroidota bacterium]
MIVFALGIIGHSIYVAVQNDNNYYNSGLYSATVDKTDQEKVALLCNWPFDELSTTQQANAYYSLAISLHNLNQLDKAEWHLNKVLELSPGTIGEYLIESSTYDRLHADAILLLADIALKKKDFRRVESLIDQAVYDYPFSGCGTALMERYNSVKQLKIELALATQNDQQAIEILGQQLFFHAENDTVRIKELVKLIKTKYPTEFIDNELNGLLEKLEEVRIMDHDYSDLELYEYNTELFGVKLTVHNEYGFPYEVGKEFMAFCVDDLQRDRLPDCLMKFLKHRIQTSFFYQEL